jgi:hypothetical protein
MLADGLKLLKRLEYIEENMGMLGKKSLCI